MLHHHPANRRQAWQIQEGVSSPRHILNSLHWAYLGVDDALMVASIAATAASAGAGMKANSDIRKSQQNARNAELLRQANYQKQAAAVANESVANASRAEADQTLQQGADARKAAYARITAPVTATATTAPTVNRSVVTKTPTATATTQNNALTAAWNRILGGAQSRLGAYDDWGLGNAIANQRAAEKLSIINANARNSAGVLAGEMQDASHAGDGMNAVAGILGALGNIGGAYVATTPRKTRTVN